MKLLLMDIRKKTIEKKRMRDQFKMHAINNKKNKNKHRQTKEKTEIKI